MVAYPYRAGEVMLPNIPEIKSSTRFGKIRINDRHWRPPIKCAPFGHISGSLPPCPDTTDTPTLLAGTMKRFLFQPPALDKALFEGFRSFVKKWITENLNPLPVSEDVSFDTWVEGINHPESRKEELRKLWTQINGDLNRQKHSRVKMFMKEESYTDYKHGRAINSRHDAYKCATGPYFHAIEKVLFQLKYFIKYVPVVDRPKVILERLYREGAVYFASDFTAFESLFTEEVMLACEVPLYDYMTQLLPGHETFMEHVIWKTGENVIDNKNFSVRVNATRMSGEMDTSLGNGFSNLMLWLYLAEVNGSEIDGFVEGDDGLFRVDGPPPTSEQFAKLGMVIKVERHNCLNTASFCGNVFDIMEQSQVTDPRYSAINLLWIPGKYASVKRTTQLSLLRSKALSMKYQYPNHPILTPLSDRILFLTRGFDLKRVMRQGYLNMWERDQLCEAIKNQADLTVKTEIPMRNRLLVEELYGVTVEQQLYNEQQCANFELGDTLAFSWDIPASWQDYYRRYTTEAYADIRAATPGTWAVDYKIALPVRPNFVDPKAGWAHIFDQPD